MKNYFVLKKKNIMNETYHLVRRDEFDNQWMPMASFSICHWPSNTMNFKPLKVQSLIIPNNPCCNQEIMKEESYIFIICGSIFV